MLENLITPEFLAKQEGISVEEARQALELSKQLTHDVDEVVEKSLDDDSTDASAASSDIANLVNGFVTGLTGKTTAELYEEGLKKQAQENDNAPKIS